LTLARQIPEPYGLVVVTSQPRAGDVQIPLCNSLRPDGFRLLSCAYLVRVQRRTWPAQRERGTRPLALDTGGKTRSVTSMGYWIQRGAC
jgi:hypothetical protein